MRRVGRWLLTALAALGAIVGAGWLWGRRKPRRGTVAATEAEATAITQQAAAARADTLRAADMRAMVQEAREGIDARLQDAQEAPQPSDAAGVADAFNRRARPTLPSPGGSWKRKP